MLETLRVVNQGYDFSQAPSKSLDLVGLADKFLKETGAAYKAIGFAVYKCIHRQPPLHLPQKIRNISFIQRVQLKLPSSLI